jgi:hypothetical protein
MQIILKPLSYFFNWLSYSFSWLFPHVPTQTTRERIQSGESTPDGIIEEQGVELSPREEELHVLFRERQELHDRILRYQEEVEYKQEKLASLQEQDDVEKWEDLLFEKRLKELESARSVIPIQSSVHAENVRSQVNDINHEIARTAKIACATTISKPVEALENISSYLQENLVVFFQRNDDRLRDERIVQAILQIFLAESCIQLIDCWTLEKPGLDELLGRLYSRIYERGERKIIEYDPELRPEACLSITGEQGIARKWRQITITQMHNENFPQKFQQYANTKAWQLKEISAAAGWGGDSLEAQNCVQKLMELAANIRMDVKAGNLSRDLRPWIASYGDRYDSLTMKDVGGKIGGLLEVGDGECCHVLGSTELGLTVKKASDESKPEVDVDGWRLRPKVLLLESFWKAK